MQKKAKYLRRNQTDAERKLWSHLRNRQIVNKKFRRQHAIGNYIVDFVCLETKLVIEIDGGQHLEQMDYDQNRTNYLELLDFRVVRFWNNEVLQEIEAVLNAIYMAISDPPHPNPLP